MKLQVISKLNSQLEDEIVTQAFLDKLALDIRENPDAVQPITPHMLQRLDELVQGIEIDLDTPLNTEAE